MGAGEGGLPRSLGNGDRAPRSPTSPITFTSMLLSLAARETTLTGQSSLSTETTTERTLASSPSSDAPPRKPSGDGGPGRGSGSLPGYTRGGGGRSSRFVLILLSPKIGILISGVFPPAPDVPESAQSSPLGLHKEGMASYRDEARTAIPGR